MKVTEALKLPISPFLTARCKWEIYIIRTEHMEGKDGVIILKNL